MEYLNKKVKSLGQKQLWTHLSFSEHELEQLRKLQGQARSDASPQGQRAMTTIEGILHEIERRRSEGCSYDYAVALHVYKTAEKSIYRIDLTSIFEAAHIVRGGKRHIYDVPGIDSPYKYHGRTDKLDESEIELILASHPNSRLMTTAICPSLLRIMDADDYEVLASYDEIAGSLSKTWDIPSFLRMGTLYTSAYKTGQLDNVTQRLTGLMLTKLSREYAECHLNERLDRAFSGNGLNNEERLKELIPLNDERLANHPKTGNRLTNKNNRLLLAIYHLLGKDVSEHAHDFYRQGHQWFTYDFLSKMLPAEIVEYLRECKRRHGIHDSSMTLMTSHGSDLRNDFEDHLADVMYEFPFGGMHQFREHYEQFMSGWALQLYGRTGDEPFDASIDNLILAGDTEAAFVACYSKRAMKMVTRSLQHMPKP